MGTREQAAAFALSFIVGMSLLACVVSGRELVALYYASADGPAKLYGLAKASEISPANWRYPLHLGRLRAAIGDHERAFEYFADAVSRFPACGSCWLGVAEAQAALGADPFDALGHARRYGRSETTVRTRAAVLFAKSGMHEEAAAEFSAALGGKQADRTDFYVLLSRLYPPDFVLDRIITDADLATYFLFAKRHLDSDSVARVWQRFEPQNASTAYRRGYVRYLIAKGYAHEAWRVAYGEDGASAGRVVNGDFEAMPDGSGFGWEIEEAEGVRAGVYRCTDCRDRSRALRLRFDGEHNVHYFGASQVVPVMPGATYRLSYRVRYSDLTSARGPALFVRGLELRESVVESQCDLRAASEEFLGSSPWRRVDLEFTVPEACQGIRIAVGRPRTKRLNKFIGGELWVDDLAIESVSAPGETAQQTSAALAPALG